MKKKTLFIVIAVVAVMAVFTAAAYAYFTWTPMNSSAQVESGGMTATLESNPVGPISIEGLMPSDGTIHQDVYYKITNTGDADARFAVFVDPDSFSGNTDLFNHLRMDVVLHPSTGPFAGTGLYGPQDYPIRTNGWVSEIWGAGNALNNSGAGVELLYKDMAAVYKVTLWLDGPNSGNDLQNKACSFNLKWVGGQPEAAPGF